MVSGPGGRSAAAAALSAAEARPTRPVTPPAARPAQSRVTIYLPSDYFEDYDSPSRRVEKEEDSGAAAKGFLGGLGLGWFANKLRGQNNKKTEEERLRLEDERRDGRHGSRYTGDGYGTPSRPARRGGAPAPTYSDITRTSFTEETGSSQLESRPPGASHVGPPMPPLGADNLPPPPIGGAQQRHSRSRSRSRSRPDNGPVDMPAMPPDPAGLFSSLNPESATESYMSASGRPQQRRPTSGRHRDGEMAAAAAAATAHHLAQEQEEERRRDHSRPPGQPVSVKVKYHDDRGNVTLRRLTDEEAAAARQDRQRRSNSVSSLSGSETPGRRRRYRRSSTSSRRGGSGEEATGPPPTADSLAPSPLSPPAPSFAGRRQKDSAYYSGQPGPSGGHPAAAQTVSSIGSPESHGTHGTWSALSPTPSSPVTNRAGSVAASAADRRRRRRSERQNTRPTGTMEFN